MDNHLSHLTLWTDPQGRPVSDGATSVCVAKASATRSPVSSTARYQGGTVFLKAAQASVGVSNRLSAG